jgi:hypothetical protein
MIFFLERSSSDEEIETRNVRQLSPEIDETECKYE